MITALAEIMPRSHPAYGSAVTPSGAAVFGLDCASPRRSLHHGLEPNSPVAKQVHFITDHDTGNLFDLMNPFMEQLELPQ
jgi:hypothetical protein